MFNCKRLIDKSFPILTLDSIIFGVIFLINYREEQLRRERDDLMSRLEQSENRHEELSGSVSAATRPLLRQIESLQVFENVLYRNF